MRILIVENNRELSRSLKKGLEKSYILKFTRLGKECLSLVDVHEYDVILLDLGLPDMPGLEVCQKIRALGVTTPILILNAEPDIDNKVSLLDAGADDYLTKPFTIEELQAHIRALLRRKGSEIRDNTVQVGDLVLDGDSRKVMRGGQEIELRRKEFDLLEYLMRNKGYVVSRAMVLDNVWGMDADIWTNSIDVHIKYLRDKIDKPYEDKLIKTVHGVGYKIESDNAKPTVKP